MAVRYLRKTFRLHLQLEIASGIDFYKTCCHSPIFFSKPPIRRFLGRRAEDTARLGG